MSKKQVVYLNLFQFRFPATAIASVLHRISGVILFLFVPGALWVLQQSLAGEESYQRVAQFRDCLPLAFAVWVFLSALFYHLVAGIRALLMDICIGDTKKGGRIGSYFVILISIVFALLTGVAILC